MLSSRLSAAALCAALTVSLAACGGSPAPEEATGSGGTRIVSDAVDEIEVPERPQRVAMLYQTSALEIALRHGVPVVGAGHSPLLPGGFPSWIDSERTAGIADTGWEEADIEAVAGLQPDLIISYPDAEENERLAQLAPVARVDETSDALSRSVGAWRQMLLTSGELLGVRDGVEADLAELDERIADLRGRIADDISVSAVRVSGKHGASVYPAGRLHAALLEELDVERPPAQAFETGSAYEEFSAERIPELDADVVYVYGVDEAEGGEQALAELQGNPLWANLAAAGADQVHVVESGPWNEVASIGAAHLLLDEFEARLTGARDVVSTPTS